MSKSGRLRLSDVRQVFRLLGDCRDLGDDPAAWFPLLIDGLASLVRSRWTTGGVWPAGGFIPPQQMPLSLYRGWSSDRELQDFRRFYLEELGVVKETVFQRFMAVNKRFYTRQRQQLVSDREWYTSFDFNDRHRVLGCDHLMATRRTRDGSGLNSMFMTSRNVGERPFPSRDQRVLQLLHAEVGRLLGTALAVQPGGLPEGLPQRLRQTLERLLEGDSEKQAALRLGLSRHTVHEYVTALYRRFGVSSRAELLALWLRRSAAANGPQPGQGGSFRRS